MEKNLYVDKISVVYICFFRLWSIIFRCVFTVFVTVGLVPRFADKTHTARKIVLYENSIVSGAILGCLFSVYPEIVKEFGGKAALSLIPNWGVWGSLLLSVFGIFAGMFVGCFAIAIAEMLNTIPIFTIRIRLGKGIGIVLLFLALGKTVGSLIYFYLRLGY